MSSGTSTSYNLTSTQPLVAHFLTVFPDRHNLRRDLGSLPITQRRVWSIIRGFFRTEVIIPNCIARHGTKRYAKPLYKRLFGFSVTVLSFRIHLLRKTTELGAINPDVTRYQTLSAIVSFTPFHQYLDQFTARYLRSPVHAKIEHRYLLSRLGNEKK